MWCKSHRCRNLKAFSVIFVLNPFFFRDACVLSWIFWDVQVWVANTIGLLNYKFFVLFLCWAWLGCIIRYVGSRLHACTLHYQKSCIILNGRWNVHVPIFLTICSASLLLKPSIAFFSGDEVAIARSVGAFLAFVFTAAFSLALTGFIIMHWSLIKKNQTTIEAYEKSPLRYVSYPSQYMALLLWSFCTTFCHMKNQRPIAITICCWWWWWWRSKKIFRSSCIGQRREQGLNFCHL